MYELIPKMRYKWSQAKINRIVNFELFPLFLFSSHSCIVCMISYVSLSASISSLSSSCSSSHTFVIFSFFSFSTPQRQETDWGGFFFARQNYAIFVVVVVDNFHSVCVCKILHTFVQWLTHIGLCHSKLSFFIVLLAGVSRVFFPSFIFFFETKSY